MKLNLLSLHEMTAKAIYEFEDSKGNKRTVIVHPNESISLWSSSGSITLNKDGAKELIDLLQQFIDRGEVEIGSIYDEHE